MAGNLSVEHLKDVPRCNHGTTCVLKTGTSKNSSHGKSFFICNSVEGRCSFATHAKGFEATTCTLHQQMVELKAFANKENGVRCYYRCVFGKEKGQTWCGHELIKPHQQPAKSVLTDCTNTMGKTNRLQSKISNNGTKSTEAICSNPKSNVTNNVSNDNNKEVPLNVEKRTSSENINNVGAKDGHNPKTDITQCASGIPGRLACVIDMSQSSFNAPRDKRISDISDSSSANSSNVSNESANESVSNDVYHVPQNAEVDVVDVPQNAEVDVVDSSMLSNNSDDLYDEAPDNDGGGDSDLIEDSSSYDNQATDSEEFRVDGTCSTANKNNVFNVPQNAEVELSSTTEKGGEKCHEKPTNVFDVPQNALVGIPPTSGKDTEKSRGAVEKAHKEDNIIEISDSSDEETAFAVDVASSSRVREPAGAARSAAIDQQRSTSSKQPTPPTDNPTGTASSNINPSLFWSKIHSLKLQIQRQQEVYGKVGAIMPDGGEKLMEHIRCLHKELEITKKDFSEAQRTYKSKPYGSLPMNVHYPSINNGSVQYTHPHSGHEENMLPNAGQYKPTPLFGGRMTEKRLKEVGKITAGSIEQLHKSLESRPTPTDEAGDPKGLNVTLMVHQKQALAWLLWREKQNPPGGILADDMGLGKTLTMISLSLKSKQEDLRQIKELPKESKLVFSSGTVIVCPASLVHQWQKEIEKRVTGVNVSVCVYHGPSREKRIKRLANNDIVLTTYNIAGIEGKKFSIDEKGKPQNHLSEWLDSTQSKVPEEGPLFKIFWRRIVLDEGHTIKNYKTGSSVAICALEGESRWIVTGTPIQNNTMELYSLIKFIRVTPFNELKVWKREVDNKSSSGTKRMNSIVASLLLRRTKDQVDAKTGKPLIVLPKQSKVVHKLKLSKHESEVYELVQNYSKKVFTKFLDTRKDAADRGISTNPEDKEKETYQMPDSVLGIKVDKILKMLGLHGSNVITQGCLLVLVLRLRQCCTHLSLMCEEIDPDTCKSEGIDVPIEESFANLSIDEDRVDEAPRPNQMLPTFSSTKITMLLSWLRDIKKQSTSKPIKSVIVSQWSRMLDVVAFHLRAEGYKYAFITGSVNVKKRSDIVEAFNNDRYPEIMLLSLKAGGVGLNLIGGNHLFLLDQHWNPALEEQASDRIYRVGQKNDVMVHRFLCTDTVEERIAALQEKKKALAHSVLYGGKAAQKLTLQDLKMIFGLAS